LVIAKALVLLEIVHHMQIMCGMEETGDTWEDRGGSHISIRYPFRIA